MPWLYVWKCNKCGNTNPYTKPDEPRGGCKTCGDKGAKRFVKKIQYNQKPRRKRVDAYPMLAQVMPKVIKRVHFQTHDMVVMLKFTTRLTKGRLPFTFEERYVRGAGRMLLVRAPNSGIQLYDRCWELSGGEPRKR